MDLCKVSNTTKKSAGDGSRTHDLFITNEVLYQLSYPSVKRKNPLKVPKVERVMGIEPT